MIAALVFLTKFVKTVTMIYTDEEKLDILKELINMAQADGLLRKEEISFIRVLGSRLELENEIIEDILNSPEKCELKIPKSQTKRIVHFHRMMLMMHIDGIVTNEELQLLHEVALRYGIRKSTVQVLLDTMKQYPHGEIPPTELIGIHMRDNN